MMRVFILLAFIFISGQQAYAQHMQSSDEADIKRVINQFFESLEKRDTSLMKATSEIDGQVWVYQKTTEGIKTSTRFFRDDMNRLHTLPPVLEKAIHFEILIRDGLAMAWVPYKFWVNDEFRHCGVNAFTLIKMDGTWKIVSAAYTVETENCEDLDDGK